MHSCVIWLGFSTVLHEKRSYVCMTKMECSF